MHRMLIGGTLAALCFAMPAVGQDDFGTETNNQDNVIIPSIEPVQVAPVQQQAINQAPEQVTMTPEAYRALQYKPTPRELVQRRAALQGAQRRARIASREWYGVSLSRPMASPLPHMGTYSAYWAGTYHEPSLWLDNFYYDGYYQNYQDVQVIHRGIR